MSALRNKLIRLAHAKPELRPHLLPLLREARGVSNVEPWWNQDSGAVLYHLSQISRGSFVDIKNLVKVPNPLRSKGRVSPRSYAFSWLRDEDLIYTVPSNLGRGEWPGQVAITGKGRDAAKLMETYYDNRQESTSALKGLKALAKTMRKKYPKTKLSFGHLGEVEGWNDNRTWYFFTRLSRPGSNGTQMWKWGGYRTSDASDFLRKAQTGLGSLLVRIIENNDGPYKGPRRRNGSEDV